MPDTRRVIVGEPFRQTPQFAGHITHVVVHPSWHVPPSIAAEEILPLLRAAPESFADDIEVWTTGPLSRRIAAGSVDWSQEAAQAPGHRFVQRPGPRNPLGRVKFLLPNPFAVFLHDTPGTGLFERQDRDLSHGCVRVEGAVDLARTLLDDRARVRFEALLAATDTGTVELPEPLATYVIYWTVSVTATGEVHFLRDAYDADRRLLEALDNGTGARPWVSGLRSREVKGYLGIGGDQG